MEDHPQFDLTEHLQVWRETVSKTSGLRDENLEELELHLRDSFEALKTRGLAEDEAFPDQVIFRTPVRTMGGFLVVNVFAEPAAIVVILFLLILSAAKFGAVRKNAPNGRSALVPLIALVGLLAPGCDRGQQTQSGSTQPVTAASSSSANQTQFEKCLSSWSGGNQDAAIQSVLDMNLRDAKLFSPGSALALSEAQFIALPQAARESLGPPMLADLASIKGLCRRLQEEGRAAKARGDAAKATKCFGQIKLLGEQLDQPSVVVIGQLVGKALKKLAAKE